MRILALLLFAMLACCHSPAPVPPAPEAGDASAEAEAPDASLPGVTCASACANLAQLGCPEGISPKCVPTCERIQGSRITDVKPDCLATAKDKAAVRACGLSVRCL